MPRLPVRDPTTRLPWGHARVALVACLLLAFGCGTDDVGVCGDGVVNGSEACDDAAHNGAQGYCRLDCAGPVAPACDPARDEDCGACPPGQVRDGAACVDRDGCAEQPCFVGVACTDVAAPGDGFSCGPCPAGYAGDGQTCRGLGACAGDPCFEGVVCRQVPGAPGGYECGACPEGYEGDGKTCVDADGCAGQPCFPGVTCTDELAPSTGFLCGSCPAGLEGDGQTCTDVDGCAEGACFPGVECTDVAAPGEGYRCGACPEGYEGDGLSCADADGCAAHPCFAGVDCFDIPAPGQGFLCGVCPAGYEGDGQTCRDVDGCLGQPCFDGVQCTDVPAPGLGAQCGACPAGYVGDGRTCTNRDDCAAHPCFPGVACTDVPPPGLGAQCGACPPGTTGDGRTCTDIDGCAANPCFAGVTCTDVPAPGLGAQCGACPPGTTGDGRTCTDIDGCAATPCFAGVTCTDVPAPGLGYQCGACPPGHEGDGSTCWRKTCDALPPLENGYVSCPQGTRFNDSCTLTCYSGSQLVGDASRTCQADRSWSGAQPRCEPVVCQPPAVGAGSVACSNGFAYGSLCTLTCDRGWAVRPDDRGVYGARCVGAGTWSTAFAQCAVCASGFTGPRCQYSDQEQCSGHGTARYDGTCQCQPGFLGPRCACSDQTTCNGHGVADAACGCTCFDNSFVGHFAGPSCGTCAPGWAGADCLGRDADRDGYATKDQGGPDCDDGNSAIYPGAPDGVGGGVDESCDGIDGMDADRDGEASAASGGLDCDDQDAYANTGAAERVNQKDDDCDGAVDEDIDDDQDGFADVALGGSDCEDLDPAIRPGASDSVGNGVDDNCDGVDGTDADRDGHASMASGGADCDDGYAGRYPGAPDQGYLRATTRNVRSWDNRTRPGNYTIEGAIALAVGRDAKVHTLAWVYQFGRGHSLAFDAETIDDPYARDCALGVSADQRPHLLCKDELHDALVYRTRSDASTWAPSETLISPLGSHPYDLAVSPSGRAHVVVQDPASGALWYRVRYQGQTGWQARKLADSLAQPAFRVRAAPNDASDVHVLFFDETAGELRLWSFGDFAETLRVVAQTDQVGTAMDVAVDAQGNPHVAYWDGAALQFARLVEGRWLRSVAPGIAAAPRKIAMAVDADGDVHLAASVGGELHLLRHARGVWQETTAPFAPPGPNFEVVGDDLFVPSASSNYYWETLQLTTYRHLPSWTDLNCDGIPGVDDDGDGVASVQSGGLDCDDLDPEVKPAATELCDDEADNDCDGLADEAACD